MPDKIKGPVKTPSSNLNDLRSNLDLSQGSIPSNTTNPTKHTAAFEIEGFRTFIDNVRYDIHNSILGLFIVLPKISNKITTTSFSAFYAISDANVFTAKATPISDLENLTFSQPTLKAKPFSHRQNKKEHLELGTLTREEAQSLPYYMAEIKTSPEAEPNDKLTVITFDHYEPRVKTVFFSRSDLIQMAHYQAENSFSRWVFSSAQLNFGTMLNPKSQLERFTTLEREDRPVIVNDASICFTLKAEFIMFPNPTGGGNVTGPVNQPITSTMVGLPCPTYWSPDGILIEQIYLIDDENSELKKQALTAIKELNIEQFLDGKEFSVMTDKTPSSKGRFKKPFKKSKR